MKKYDYHLIVIGGGAGGLSAAVTGCHLGAKVALIEKDRTGGECLYTGCVPSKSLVSYSQSPKSANLYDYIKGVIQTIEPHDSIHRLEAMGISVYQGQATFIDPHTIQVEDQVITGKRIIIATGSRVHIPDIPGLAGTPYLSHETVFDLKSLPQSMIIIGSGPMALELGQAYQKMGVAITLLARGDRLLKNLCPQANQVAETFLTQEGMQIIKSAKIKHITYEGHFEVSLDQGSVQGQTLLLATGKRPNTCGLNLEKIQLKLDEKGFIACNNRMQSSHKHIYACGDVAGPHLLTHMANYQATRAVQNALLPMRLKVAYDQVPYVIYTSPEIAHVGPKFDDTFKDLAGYQVFTTDWASNDRAITDHQSQGFMKVLTYKGVLVAATIIGPGAGKLLPLIIKGIKDKTKLRAYLNLIIPYPSQAEMIKDLAIQALKSQTKDWQLSLLKRLFFS